MGFELARRRRRKVAVCAFYGGLVPSDSVFVADCREIAQEYPDVDLLIRKVDTFAGTVITDPAQYDVVVAPNEWGSIMTDLFAAACGSVALAARGNIGDETGCFEPIHGTAPGKAGKGTVNPISQILAAKLLLEWLGSRFDDPEPVVAAKLLQGAVERVLSEGDVMTADLGGTSTTQQVVEAVSKEIRYLHARA